MVITRKLAALWARIQEKIPVAKRRMFIMTAAGVIAIIILIITGISLIVKGSNQDPPAAASATARRGIIPPEDLFLPDEPDFIPGVILDREKRSVWTVDDVMPWWQDPSRDGEEQWRDRIERTIDELMENVQ